MKHGTRIKEVVSEIQALEMLANGMVIANTAISVIVNGATHFVPVSVLDTFRRFIIAATDKATIELFAEYERLVKESLER